MTSTLTVPSGSWISCLIVPSVPTSKISSGAGSLVLALRCAHNTISFPAPIASLSALMLLGRPTKRGTTMFGKTMISRSGSSGIIRDSPGLLSSESLENDMKAPGGMEKSRWPRPSLANQRSRGFACQEYRTTPGVKSNERHAVSAVISANGMGVSSASAIISSVITIFLTSERPGTSYIRSIIVLSKIVRRPRAPVL